ncbi:hypothetical protein DVH05_017995 [Phytophthora capsici]|nr:hypothetical protein DVH05_017995 [Phytophthora capsici]
MAFKSEAMEQVEEPKKCPHLRAPWAHLDACRDERDGGREHFAAESIDGSAFSAPPGSREIWRRGAWLSPIETHAIASGSGDTTVGQPSRSIGPGAFEQRGNQSTCTVDSRPD